MLIEVAESPPEETAVVTPEAKSLLIRPDRAADDRRSDPGVTATAPEVSGTIEVDRLSCFYGGFRALRELSLRIRPRAVTAIIGPSGCGKSTFLRSLNRMHELAPGG